MSHFTKILDKAKMKPQNDKKEFYREDAMNDTEKFCGSYLTHKPPAQRTAVRGLHLTITHEVLLWADQHRTEPSRNIGT